MRQIALRARSSLPAPPRPQHQPGQPDHRPLQALGVWAVFIGVTIVLNGTIPFVLGADVRTWTYSSIKSALVSFIDYGVLFLVVPLLLTKGIQTVRRPSFLAPLVAAVAAVTLWSPLRGVASIALVVLAYLHERFDLSELGVRSRGRSGDVAAALLIGLMGVAHALGGPTAGPAGALFAAADRLFANPASFAESLFYFGFLTERLATRTRWMTPVLIGLMYTIHEASNPEYWYEAMRFEAIFAGVTVLAAVYLWRRSVVVIWIGDGLSRFTSALA